MRLIHYSQYKLITSIVLSFYVFTFLFPQIALSEFQEVFTLTCADIVLTAEARLFSPNEGGSAKKELRFRVGKTNIHNIRIEEYYKNLDEFLPKDAPSLDFPLKISTDGLNHYGGEYEYGVTLFIPPSQFSKKEFENIHTCISDNFPYVREVMQNKVLKESYLLGLYSVKTTLGLDGIAKMIYAEFPFMGIYTNGRYALFIINNRDAILKVNNTADDNKYREHIGYVSNEKLHVQAQHIMFENSLFDLNHLLLFRDRSGEKLSERYDLVFSK